MKKSLLIIITFSFYVFNTFCQVEKDTVLAKVEGEIISNESFKLIYNSVRSKFDIQDNLANREKVLQEIINDHILVNYAKANGLTEDRVAEDELNRIKIQTLLNEYTEKFISPQVIVTDENLIETFRRINTKLKVSHIYSPTQAGIDSLYNQLLSGNRFDNIAATSFSDQYLRKNKGSLGFISYDEMDPAFEDEAFNLTIGEISKPIKTSTGYSIIRLDDKVSSPLLTENEFLNKKDKFYTYARKKKFEKFIKEYTQSLSSSLITGFNEKIIDQLYETIITTDENKIILSENDNNISTALSEETIVYTTNGDWSIQKFLSAAKLTSEGQHNFIRNKENLKEFISGLIVRDFMLNEARENKLGESEVYNANVNQIFEEYLIRRIENKFKDEIAVDDSEIEQHYRDNIQQYQQPPQIRLSSILLDDSSKVQEVKLLLASGNDFGELARKYSIQTLTAEKNGDMGLFSMSELSELDEDVYQLKPGQVIGPLVDENKFVFLKCTDKLEGFTIPLENLKDKIAEEIRGMKWQEERESIINEYSTNMTVVVHKEKLKTINLYE